MICGLTIVFIALSICKVASLGLNANLPEDARLNFSGLANKYGMACEEYDLITEDGYILKLYHIPGDKTRPVLLIHGLISTSDDFILKGHDSMGKHLSNAGYDIWVSNYRGNRYSRRHVTLDPDMNMTFWNFSQHEYGTLDLAAAIDFILDKTNEPRLSLVGHSEGNLIMYVLGSTRPEYNDKIKVLIALAPVCHLYFLASRYPFLLEIGSVIKSFLNYFQIEEILAYDSKATIFLRKFCTYSVLNTELCRRTLLLLTGFDPDGIDSEVVRKLLGHSPAGTSRKNLEHYMQILNSRRFAHYDYGVDANLVLYNSSHPPKYDLSKVTVKVVLLAAKNDVLSTLEDVRMLKKKLPNVVEYRINPVDHFNHLDYIYGSYSYKVLYPDLLKFLQKYDY